MDKFFNTLGGKKVAFIGAGVNHRELIPMFAQAGAQVTLCDRKMLDDLGPFGDELMALGVRLSLGESYLGGLAGQDMVLRTPGFEYFSPELQQAAENGVLVTSEMELFFRNCPCQLVGITGSDGKTTTTMLVAAMYEASGRTVHVGGSIGRPLLPLVDTIKENDIAVVELSSAQLISMKESPEIAVVTNVVPGHPDIHQNMEEYINAKRNLLLYQNQQGVAVLGYDNSVTNGMQRDVQGNLRWFSRLNPVAEGACLDENGWLCLARGGTLTPLLAGEEVALRGAHNLENLLAAYAAVRDELPAEILAETARTFTGVEHRIEPVRTLNGAVWYNDSVATSPLRVVAGLHSFTQKLIVIAGGYDKDQPYELLARDMLERVRLLILMGDTGPRMEAALRNEPGYAESGIEIRYADDMEHAVRIASENAGEGDIVTLSPAADSFDRYPNFEARGRHYKQLVNSL